MGTFSSEVLFEVWDRCPKSQTEEERVLVTLNDPALAERFLGLGIVSVDELLITPSQRWDETAVVNGSMSSSNPTNIDAARATPNGYATSGN